MGKSHYSIRKPLAILWLVGLLLSLSALVAAQNQEAEYLEKVRSVTLKESEHPSGWELLEERGGIAAGVERGPFAASLRQSWRNAGGVEVGVTYMVLYDVKMARQFFREDVGKGWHSLSLPANDGAAQVGAECYLLRDDVFIAIGAYADENGRGDFELSRQVAAAISTKLDAAGIVKSLPELRASAELDTLAWTGNQDVTVHVSSEGALEDEQRYYGLHLYSGSRRVYVQTTPEGLENAVTMTIPSEKLASLSPGSYRLGAGVEGELGRRYSVFFDVTVLESESEPEQGTQTLPTTRDTTLVIRNPHQNEGANPRLHLKKVQGKPAQVVVGFDTANIDTNGLTKASLVLNIDSTQNVTGWGNGRPIRAQRLLTAWTEGNGKSLDIPNNQKTAGSGSGATWFSPVDGNISNDQADSAVNWNGGATYAAPSTAPTALIKNHQSGEVVFDVTQDLVNSAEHGWLITRDQDVGSQVTFLSKEGGSSDLAPKLILEYGDSVANLDVDSRGLVTTLGFRKAPGLARSPSGSELKTAREILQDSPVAAMLTEQALTEITRGNPAISIASRVAYRSWLEQEPRLAVVREFQPT